MSFSVVIPARYASTRLPGKLLMDIAGKPMLEHVYLRAKESGAEQIIIAADDPRIEEVAREFGATVCMTSMEHLCGSDRIAEVIAQKQIDKDRIVVNLQGDEPFIPPALIQQVAHNLAKNPHMQMATLCEKIKYHDEVLDPHVVKVVFDKLGRALYFSRAPIAWTAKQTEQGEHFRHIGLYAAQAKFLTDYVNLLPAPLEKMESLEQLRVLWHGYDIHIATACESSPVGIDTPQDLEKIRQFAKQMETVNPEETSN